MWKPTPHARQAFGLALAATLSTAAVACTTETAGEDGDTAPITGPVDTPVPPADGPKLLALAADVPVYDRPSFDGEVLGTLYLGARVARAEAPHSTAGCAGGWYPIRPRGFVCAGEATASADENHPLARVVGGGPDLDSALPYRYARVWAEAAVTYGSLPSPETQAEAEPKLSSFKTPKDTVIGSGAGDVPLDDGWLPTGPPVVRPGAPGVGEDGYRTSRAWLADATTSVDVDAAFGAPAETSVVKRNTRLALVASTDDDRPLGLTASGRFVPLDRLEPVLGSTFHGVRLTGRDDLPVAFALRAGVRGYALGKGASATRTDDEYSAREAVRLTGRYRTVNRQRYWFTDDDHWVRHKDLIVILKRTKFPDFATGTQKWIDISLANQTLVAWEGKTPRLATLISSGQDRLGDPETGPATRQGVFRILDKAITGSVDGREVGLKYALLDVPWIMRFDDGFAITGCTWHDRFGEALSHHNVALAPVDAHFLWRWSEPALPDGWNRASTASPADASPADASPADASPANASPANASAGETRAGTIVYVHR